MDSYDNYWATHTVLQDNDNYHMCEKLIKMWVDYVAKLGFSNKLTEEMATFKRLAEEHN